MAQPGANVTFGDRNSGFQAGVIHGPVHNEFHPPPERTETPPSPSCSVPFRRDRDFVDRGTLLEEIREKCSAPASRIALVGLGGVGKSQLAIEHCYRTADQSPETWVFWVHASTAARIEQGFQDIAEEVKLPGRNDPQADVFKLVFNWLRNKKNGKWLLILDNADDATALTLPVNNVKQEQTGGRNNASPHFSSYIPQSENGSVLVTSRTRSVASQLVEESDIIPIDPMDDTSAQALLHIKLGEGIDKKKTAELATVLEFMPLALVQAASYIRQRAPRCSVQHYLEEFCKSDRKKTSLLDYSGGHLRRDNNAKNSILITWQISFKYILKIRRSAADLLSLMSFFDRQGIPEELLQSQHGRRNHPPEVDSMENSDNDSEPGISADDEFEEDIVTLRNYSFITVSNNGNSFDMHRLVQLATRKWLEEQDQLEIWKQRYIYQLCASFPTGEYENWAQCHRLFPHAKSALSQTPESEKSLRHWALLLYKAAWYAWRKKSLIDAEKLSAMSLKVRKKLLGEDHVETLKSAAMLARAKYIAGRWSEAEELEVQVMHTRLRILGEEHPSTLNGMANLASTYRNQGRWKEAEELFVKVMETNSRVLKEGHSSTLNSMANLAATYRNQGRLKEAEELLVKVIKTRSGVLGEDHPSTLNGMANLASTYRNQGRWKEAEELEVKVLEARSRALGAEHPSTLNSMASLASTYWNRGRWKEAEELEVKVLEASSRVLGEEHPSTLNIMANLGSTYSNQGRWKEAEELEVIVLEARSRVLGAEHPATLYSMANLASTYWNQGRWKEAEDRELKVIETRSRVLGEWHPSTLSSMASLGSMYSNQRRWKEAEELEMKALEVRSRFLGVEHPSTLNSMANLGSTYSNQGKWKEAEELEVKVLEARSRVLGEEHPSTLNSMANLGSTYSNQGRWKEAEELLVKVMETSSRVLGEEHPDTLSHMANLAYTLQPQNRQQEAVLLLQTCVQIRTRILGPSHPYTVSSIETLNKWQMNNSIDG